MRPSQCSQSVVVDQSGTNTAQSFAKGLDEFGTPPDGRLFVAERGGRIGNSTYRRVWAHARETAFTSVMTATLLAKRPYDLRHACVSFSLNARVEATGVAEWGRAQPERASTGLREVHRRRAAASAFRRRWKAQAACPRPVPDFSTHSVQVPVEHRLSPDTTGQIQDRPRDLFLLVTGPNLLMWQV